MATVRVDRHLRVFPVPTLTDIFIIFLSTTLTVPSLLSFTSASTNALYNFRLLEALRSDDPAKVQPFIDELQPSARSVEGQEDVAKAGRLLGMAVRVASGEWNRIGS